MVCQTNYSSSSKKCNKAEAIWSESGKLTIRDYFQTLNGATIEPSQLLQAGNDVYLNESAVPDGDTLHKIAEFYRAIHVTSYGQAIPNSFNTATHTSTATGELQAVLETSTNNEVFQISALEIVNSALGPVTVVLSCSSVGFTQEQIPPSTTSYVSPSIYPQIVKGGGLFMNQIDGSSGDITVNVAYHKVVQ